MLRCSFNTITKNSFVSPFQGSTHSAIAFAIIRSTLRVFSAAFQNPKDSNVYNPSPITSDPTLSGSHPLRVFDAINISSLQDFLYRRLQSPRHLLTSATKVAGTFSRLGSHPLSVFDAVKVSSLLGGIRLSAPIAPSL